MATIDIPEGEIEGIVEEFYDSSEEHGREKFWDVANATCQYFNAFREGRVKSYEQLVEFVREHATIDPLTEEITAAYDYKPRDFHRHLEGLRKVWERENKSWLQN